MADLIDRYEVLAKIYEFQSKFNETGDSHERVAYASAEHCMLVIKASPVVEAEPVRHGRWIVEDDCEHFIARCSECKRSEDSRMIAEMPYCHCGAKMDEVSEDEPD